MNDTDTLLSDETEAAETKNEGAHVILNLENLIKTHISNIDRLKIEGKKQKEMLDDIFGSDETYKAHNEKAKEAAKIKSVTKAQILQRPNVAAIAEKVKSIKSEKQELETALSDYLREYQRLSGSNEIQTNEGDIREIVYVAKLVKKYTRVK